MSWTMIKINRWKDKMEKRFRYAARIYFERHNRENYLGLSLLAFTVVSREALEAFIFVAGIGFHDPPSGLPIPAVLGLTLGILSGYLIYKGSNNISLKLFFMIACTLLFFIGAGFFSNSIYQFQTSLNSREVILWKLNCCDPKNNVGWDIAKSLFGWQNKATLGAVVSYIIYWFIVIAGILIINHYYNGKENENESFQEPNESNQGQELHNHHHVEVTQI
ncbi:19835_t:CDS:2 [Funneliformis geosporum]|uniref:19835_t:CDS:1 n=1 Tax=Funneliformis geosporum TaxID=1117311 RepID=A0A9W4WUK0_9GLOM|nr:19835_t:CDS:2 [Funneliformis geosporum]